MQRAGAGTLRDFMIIREIPLRPNNSWIRLNLLINWRGGYCSICSAIRPGNISQAPSRRTRFGRLPPAYLWAVPSDSFDRLRAGRLRAECCETALRFGREYATTLAGFSPLTDVATFESEKDRRDALDAAAGKHLFAEV